MTGARYCLRAQEVSRGSVAYRPATAVHGKNAPCRGFRWPMFLAPRVLGDAARGMFQVPALESLADDYRLTFDDFRKVGPDLRITARVVGCKRLSN